MVLVLLTQHSLSACHTESASIAEATADVPLFMQPFPRHTFLYVLQDEAGHIVEMAGDHDLLTKSQYANWKQIAEFLNWPVELALLWLDDKRRFSV